MKLKLQKNVKFISLKDKASTWASEIARMSKLQCEDTSNELIKKGFDVEGVARKLEALFISNK